MVRKPHDESLGDAVGGLIGRAAIGAVAAALLLLALALVAELLRRRDRAQRVCAVLDLTVPMWVRAAVVSLLALVATFTGPRPVGAEDSVRGWLGHSSAATTTTTQAPVATPDAISDRDTEPRTTVTTGAAVPTGPVVLIPPLTVERRDPDPAGQPPVDAPTAVPPVSVPPTPSASNHAVYVVQRGDCLWSIADRVLGGHATATSIDAGWRSIYAANRAAIGANPNLIHIGLALALPPLDAQP
ncbi:MAG: LysM peptidoglycan-binding domain-containing protein [Acidimicrobiia bacterium]